MASGRLKWLVGGAVVIVVAVVAFEGGSFTGWNAGRQAAAQLLDVAALEKAACPIPGTLWGPEFDHCVQDVDVKAQCPAGTSWDNKAGKCALNSVIPAASVTSPAATPSAPTSGNAATPTDQHCNLPGTEYVNGKCVFFNPATGQVAPTVGGH